MVRQCDALFFRKDVKCRSRNNPLWSENLISLNRVMPHLSMNSDMCLEHKTNSMHLLPLRRVFGSFLIPCCWLIMSMSFVKWSSVSTLFFGWSFDSLESISTITSYLCCCRLLIKFAKSLIISSRIFLSSRFFSSSRCHCCMVFVFSPTFFMVVWHTWYADIMVRWLWSLTWHP